MVGPPPVGNPHASIAPMLATLGHLPHDGEKWAYEFKWDGVRAVCYQDEAGARFVSRGDKDLTDAFPQLQPRDADLAARHPILDGEIVAFDERGVPSFQALQARGHHAARIAYIVFDVLHLDGRSVMDRTYEERRQILEQLQLDNVSGWSVSPSFVGDGEAVFAASGERGLEGVMAKRLDSRYLPGKRSPAWVKVKHTRNQLVVVGGWTPGSGSRSGTIGALLLGVPDGSGVRFVGKVGSGFGRVVLQALEQALGPLVTDDCPFSTTVPVPDKRVATWVRPELVGEVKFTEWTSAGRLRQPVWLGLAPGTRPADIRVV